MELRYGALRLLRIQAVFPGLEGECDEHKDNIQGNPCGYSSGVTERVRQHSLSGTCAKSSATSRNRNNSGRNSHPGSHGDSNSNGGCNGDTAVQCGIEVLL
jgi:hypothetical protein